MKRTGIAYSNTSRLRTNWTGLRRRSEERSAFISRVGGQPSSRWSRRGRPHKYHAQRTICELGHHHPSKVEAAYCQKLQIMLKGGAIQGFEHEKRYALTVNGKTIGHHKPDFTVINHDGSVEVHEVKGFMTEDWKLRKALFEVLYPDILYRVMGERDLL